jgi:uncharacterized membrane protein
MRTFSPIHRRAALGAFLAALVLTLTAPAAHADTGITTSWPVVEVEPGSEVTIPLEVTSSPVQRVDLEVTAAPDGWTTLLRGGGFVIGAATPGQEEPAEVDLEVSVPHEAPEGSHRITVTARGADGTAATVDIDLVVTEEVAGAVRFDTEFPELSGAADETFRWSVELDNALPGETTFALQAVGPPSWVVTARPSSEAQATTVTLAGGDSETIDVRAEPPTNVEAGSYDLRVIATGGGQRLELELTAVVEGIAGVELTTADERLNAAGSSGRVTRIALVVTNTGSTPLADVALSADPPAGWEVTFEPDPVPQIAPGESAEVTALVTPADDAITGDYAVGFTVDAEGRSDAIEIRFQVRTPLSWGAVGAGIIALALAGLGAVFRRFGRR